MHDDDQQNVPMSDDTEEVADEPKEDELVDAGDEPEDDDAM